MKFSYLEDVHKMWNDIIVIGKTIKRDNKKFHIIGMTLDNEAKLCIIEPYNESENCSNKIKGARNQRKVLKENRENDVREETYLHRGDFYLGNQRLQVRSGSGGSLKYDTDNYETIQVFFNMLDAGWQIPEWLKNDYGDKVQCFINNVTLLNVWKDTERWGFYETTVSRRVAPAGAFAPRLESGRALSGNLLGVLSV